MAGVALMGLTINVVSDTLLSYTIDGEVYET